MQLSVWSHNYTGRQCMYFCQSYIGVFKHQFPLTKFPSISIKCNYKFNTNHFGTVIHVIDLYVTHPSSNTLTTTYKIKDVKSLKTLTFPHKINVKSPEHA